MIGTWVIGANASEGRPEDSKTIVRNWLKLGGRGIDTAAYYQDQSRVAEAVTEANVKRRSVFIETKIPGCAGSSAEAKKWVQSCLDQLSTDYIDLMLIHFPSKTPQDCINTWKVLEQYHTAGALRAIGVSDFEINDLKSLLPAANIMPAVNQLPVNVFYHDDGLIRFCMAHNITVQAWSPLGSPGRSTRTTDLGGNRSVFTDSTVASIAAKHNVSAPQVALRWVLHLVPTLVFESSSRAHQANDADVYSFTLSHDEIAALSDLQDNGLSLSSQGRRIDLRSAVRAQNHLLVVMFLFLFIGMYGFLLCLKCRENNQQVNMHTSACSKPGLYLQEGCDSSYTKLNAP
jgi:diketogulonate reductase-like aldo/keto reductase